MGKSLGPQQDECRQTHPGEGRHYNTPASPLRGDPVSALRFLSNTEEGLHATPHLTLAKRLQTAQKSPRSLAGTAWECSQARG